MELKLIVLAGAKQGTQIPLKKDKFVIGRAKECTLRAGSDAISRRHCAILRTDKGWAVRDLGSRNGTFLNDQQLEKPTLLKPGDELRVGPLKFRVEAVGSDDSAQSHDIDRRKQPPVKDVAEAAERSAGKDSQSATEDDVSRWLLGIEAGKSENAMKETRTISMEETATLAAAATAQEHADDNASPSEETEHSDDDEVNASLEDNAEADSEDAKESSGWKWFKGGKGKEKKKAGKLPDRPDQNETTDSREAAADILREMTRRR